jgi:hypothetical protein
MHRQQESDTVTTDQQQAQAGDGVATVIPQGSQITQDTESLLMQVPDAQDNAGGQDGILAQLAAAESPEDLSKPWASNDMESLLGADVIVYGITKRPADYPGGLSHYLVVDLVVVKTGERLAVTTGSLNIVGQLVVAWVKGWMPIQARVDQAQKATRNGYFPLRLSNVSRYTSSDNGDQPAV